MSIFVVEMRYVRNIIVACTEPLMLIIIHHVRGRYFSPLFSAGVQIKNRQLAVGSGCHRQPEDSYWQQEAAVIDSRKTVTGSRKRLSSTAGRQLLAAGSGCHRQPEGSTGSRRIGGTCHSIAANQYRPT